MRRETNRALGRDRGRGKAAGHRGWEAGSVGRPEWRTGKSGQPRLTPKCGRERAVLSHFYSTAFSGGPKPSSRSPCTSECSFVDEAVILADHENIRIETELTGTEGVLAAPLGVPVAEELGRAARVEGIIFRMIDLAIFAGSVHGRAEDARADAHPMLAQEDDLRGIWHCSQRAAHHHGIPHVAYLAVFRRE